MEFNISHLFSDDLSGQVIIRIVKDILGDRDHDRGYGRFHMRTRMAMMARLAAGNPAGLYPAVSDLFGESFFRRRNRRVFVIAVHLCFQLCDRIKGVLKLLFQGSVFFPEDSVLIFKIFNADEVINGRPPGEVEGVPPEVMIFPAHADQVSVLQVQLPDLFFMSGFFRIGIGPVFQFRVLTAQGDRFPAKTLISFRQSHDSLPGRDRANGSRCVLS